VDIDDLDDFAPGMTDAGGDAGAATNEIEFDVGLGPGGSDELTLGIDDDNDSMRWGTAGVNPNARPAENTPDADLAFTGVEVHVGRVGGFGPQTLSGAGGAGTGGPFARRLELNAGFDDDTLIGGAAADLLRNSFDADVFSGGVGFDTVDYSGISCSEDCPVRVGLGAGGANDGGEADQSDTTAGKRDEVRGDIERVIGTDYDDTLIGNRVRNVLDGQRGRDRLFGRGGRDLLLARDFVQDLRLNCGKGRRDRVKRDPFDPRGRGCELPRRRKRR
jgi:hypothetical protein